ncbi:MAG: hypothetical protein ACOYOU_22090, partial [Kiritimatiellia bacterium]
MVVTSVIFGWLALGLSVITAKTAIMIGFFCSLFMALSLQGAPGNYAHATGRPIGNAFARVDQGTVGYMRGNSVVRMQFGNQNQQFQQYARQQMDPRWTLQPLPNRAFVSPAPMFPEPRPRSMQLTVAPQAWPSTLPGTRLMAFHGTPRTGLPLAPPIRIPICATSVEANRQTRLMPDRVNVVSASTLPAPLLRSHPPVVEAPAPYTAIPEARIEDSQDSSHTGPIPAPPASMPRHRTGVASTTRATTAQRPMFGPMTVESANQLIVEQLFQQTGNRDVSRRYSTSATDWPEATKVVRVEQDGVPILGAPDMASPRLDITGVASAGELCAFVDQKQRGAVLMNPLGNTPDQSGLWYQVRLLDGKQGWIFAEPQDHQGHPIARLFTVQNGGLVDPRVATNE